ncbi:hypothetical protein [Chromobacterium sp. Panama]|uniref:hypothetical protein n=1 Tax=Chromobacterium sp. Panama TaxID=2161826 RepID=UPI0011B1D873|nr:hypothetical protein [Chromobacterium sp. Panama]
MPTIENTLKKPPLLYFFISASITPILLIGIASQLMGDSSLAPIFNFLSLKHLMGSGGMQSETLKNTAAVTFSYIRLSIPIYFIAIIFLFRRDFAFSNLDLSHFSWKRVTLSLFAIGGMLAFMVYITYFDGSNLESGRYIIRIAATNPILYSILASCHVMMFYFIAHLTFISLIFQPIYLIKNR